MCVSVVLHYDASILQVSSTRLNSNRNSSEHKKAFYPHKSSQFLHAPAVACSLSEEMQVRILICGDVESNFFALQQKLEAANAKQGPFRFALCVGNFFSGRVADGDDKTTEPSIQTYGSLRIGGLPDFEVPIELRDFIAGTRKFALPVFFIDGAVSALGNQLARKFPKGVMISENLFYLGARGQKVIEGLHIAYCGGGGVSADPLQTDDVCLNNGTLNCDTGVNFSSLTISEVYPSMLDTTSAAEFDKSNPYASSHTSPHASYGRINNSSSGDGVGSKLKCEVDILATCQWPFGFESSLEEEDRIFLDEVLKLSPHYRPPGGFTGAFCNPDCRR